MILFKSVVFFVIVSYNTLSPANAVDTNPPCDAANIYQVQALGKKCPMMVNSQTRYKCRVGFKDYDDLFPSVNTVMLSNGLCTDSKCMYCDCEEDKVVRKSGMTGRTCETEFTICPDDKQVCFNGAPCIKLQDEEKYVCGCAHTSDPYTTYVGEHCEYAASEICSTGSLEYDVSKSGQWFCTHNGRCLNTSNPNDKCECKDGYFGLHCEFKKFALCHVNCHNGGVCGRGVKNFNHLSDDLRAYFNSNKDSVNSVRDLDDDLAELYASNPEFFNYNDLAELYASNPEFFNGDPGNVDTDKSYSEEESSSHCVCPKGWTGRTCEVQIDKCGQDQCLNGATCRSNKEDDNDSTNFYCDCSDITDKDGSIVPHAGKSCERIYSTMCDPPEGYSASEFFCTNEGKCAEDPHMPCICPSGFSGPRCEFEGKATKECSLPCENDGHCFFGETKETPYDQLDFSTVIKAESSEMHCKCPPGVTGFLCEIKVEVCGAYEHHCENNGVCVEEDQDWVCDCDKAITDTSYAGAKCENPATSFCLGPGAKPNYFCTNEGKCKGLISKENEGHPGCICNSGFHGDYCQFIGTKHGTGRKVFLGFTISLFGLVAIFFVLHVYRKNRSSSPDGIHHPIGVPPEVHVHAVDLDNEQDKSMAMTDGYVSHEDIEEETYENVYIS